MELTQASPFDYTKRTLADNQLRTRYTYREKGDHILVNNSYDIVGIIDWEWSQTVSKAEAFCSPYDVASV